MIIWVDPRYSFEFFKERGHSTGVREGVTTEAELRDKTRERSEDAVLALKTEEGTTGALGKLGKIVS